MGCRPVNACRVANRDIVTDRRRGIGVDVHDGIVLHACPVTDRDRRDIAPDDGVEPDAGPGTDPDVTDDHGVRGNEGVFRDLWPHAIPGQDDRAGVPFPVERGPVHQASTFRIIASPWPPPEQIPIAAIPPPLRRSSWTADSTNRAPLAPMGCPRATAPPLTLTFSGSTPRRRLEMIETLANASLISKRSMSSIEIPALSAASRIAISGVYARYGASHADCPYERMVASGVAPRSVAHASSATITAAAPSLTPGALPAVTVPCGENAGFSFASASRLVSRRGPSSVSIVTTCFFCMTLTGTISSAMRPSSIAARARWCER